MVSWIKKHCLLLKAILRKKSITLPRTDTEREMVKLFIKVLNVENVDIDDSFYSLGGHSLKMTRLLNEIEKKIRQKIIIKKRNGSKNS